MKNKGRFLSGIGGNQFLKGGYFGREDFISMVGSFMRIPGSVSGSVIVDDDFVRVSRSTMSFYNVPGFRRVYYWVDSLKLMYAKESFNCTGIDPSIFCMGEDDFFGDCFPILEWVIGDYANGSYLESDLYVLSGVVYPFNVNKLFFNFVINKFIYYYKNTGKFNGSEFLAGFFDRFGDIRYSDINRGPSVNNMVRFGQSYDFNYIYAIHLFRAMRYFFNVCEKEDIFGLYSYHRFKECDLFCDAMNKLIVNEPVLAKLGIVFNKNLE